MDSLFTILLIAAFIIISVRQDRKNKKRQDERLKRMEEEMTQENENLDTEEFENTRPTMPTMPTAEQMAERQAELRRRHEEFLAQISHQHKQNLQKNLKHKTSPKPTKSVHSKPHKPPGVKTVNKQDNPPSTPSKTTFDFDMERAVVEAEILRPKYLDY